MKDTDTILAEQLGEAQAQETIRLLREEVKPLIDQNESLSGLMDQGDLTSAIFQSHGVKVWYWRGTPILAFELRANAKVDRDEEGQILKASCSRRYWRRSVHGAS